MLHRVMPGRPLRLSTLGAISLSSNAKTRWRNSSFRYRCCNPRSIFGMSSRDRKSNLICDTSQHPIPSVYFGLRAFDFLSNEVCFLRTIFLADFNRSLGLFCFKMHQNYLITAVWHNISEFFITIITGNLLFLIGVEGFRAGTN